MARRSAGQLLALTILGTASSASAAGTDLSIFEGRYTDPKHPGGYREIKLLGKGKAKVEGGQGEGEPKFYVLDATVKQKGPRSSIIIDFTPKGGPKDFEGFWDRDGITFVRDGNHWPKSTEMDF